MSRILRRPMFRGGPVDSYGTGIASGLGTRSGYYRGGGVSYNPFNKAQTQSLVDAFKPRGLPQSFIDFFRANEANQRPSGRFRTTTPGATLEDAEGLLASNTMMTDGSAAGIEDVFGGKFGGGTEPPVIVPSTPFDSENIDFTDDEYREEIPKLGVGSDREKDIDKFYDPQVERDTGLEAIRQENIDKIDNSPKEVKTPNVNETDETEVTMTDLEKALGLDKARRRDLGDMLGRASAAFLGTGDVREGLAEFMAAETKAGPSRTERIKSIAGLEEFKAKKAQELYEAKLTAALKQKQGTKGSLQKDIEYLGTLTGADRTAALGKLGYKAPSLSAAIKELKITGQAPDPATIINLAELYIGPDFQGIVDVTEEMSGKAAGTYITTDATALVIVDEKGNTRLQKL